MTVTQQIENILKVSRQARNSDAELLIIYLQKAGMDLSDQQVELFRELPSTETIRRIRQKLQEQGKYEADTPVAKERSHKSAVMQQTVPSSRPKDIERNLGAQGYTIREWGEARMTKKPDPVTIKFANSTLLLIAILIVICMYWGMS